MAVHVPGWIWEAWDPEASDAYEWCAARTNSLLAIVVFRQERGWIRREPAHFALLIFRDGEPPQLEQFADYPSALDRVREIVCCQEGRPQ
jgi:hypothetical protein